MCIQRHPSSPAPVWVVSTVLALSCLLPGFAVAEPAAPSAHTITVIASTVPANGDVNPGMGFSSCRIRLEVW